MKRNKDKEIKALFLKDKHTKTMGVILILAIVTIYVVAIKYIIPEKVDVEYTNFDGTKKEMKYTRATTVRGAIEAENLKVSEDDHVSPCLDHKVTNGMKIKVLKSVKSKAVVAGKQKDITLFPGTVKENLKKNGIKYDKDDIVTPALNTKVAKATSIEVKDVVKKKVTKTTVIKAKDEVIFDPSVASGKVVKVAGNDGKAVCDYVTTYVNGKNTGTKRVVKKWITKTVNHSLKFGTSETGQTGSVEYSRTFTGNTTAYYMGESAYGAAGGHCVYGTCAVDPSVIPYGTKLYIEGYGFAVANDCGGAVKGNVVDLYMHNNSECYSWGRRHVKVYVLK